MQRPRVTDNDKDAITIEFCGKIVREYSYKTDDERRVRMIRAREYIEGWCDGAEANVRQIKDRLDTRLNNVLCEMKPDYDDSIVGFNEAWDIMRKTLADEEKSKSLEREHTGQFVSLDFTPFGPSVHR